MKKNINKLYDDDLELFPEYEEYISQLEILDNYKFKGLSFEEIYNTFYDYAKILPTKIGFYKTEEFNNLVFYRARIKVDEKKEDLSLIQTYLNAPTSFCDYGRANLKFKSVFYCSDNPICSILETKPEEGDEGFLSIWRGDSKKDLKLGICLPTNLPELNNWYKIAFDIFQKTNRNLNIEAKEKEKHLKLLYRFISNKFIKEKYPYPITSMISNELFYGELWRDFIVYPSLVDTAYCNLAINPNTVLNSLKFEKVIRFKVGKITGNKIQYKLGQTGVLSDNKITWRDRNDEETQLFKN